MEKTIAITETRQDVLDFLAMPEGVKKNLKFSKYYNGNHYHSGNVLIREDGTIHYSYTVYKISRGSKYFLKKNTQHGFTVDSKGKMKVWFGAKLQTVPNLHEVLVKLNKEWVRVEYLNFITSSIMGKVIAGKITNPHDLFSAILKMYRVKNASASKLKNAVEKGRINKMQLLHAISVAKNLDHFMDYLTDINGVTQGPVDDLMQQALILERKIDFNWSAKRMEEEHKLWTKELMDYESESMSKEPMQWLSKFKQLETPVLKLIETEYDLFVEGKTMSHCVYTNYYSQMLNMRYVVFHMNNNTEYGLTLGLTYEYGKLVFNQLFGRFNSQPDSDSKQYVYNWLSDINKQLKATSYEEVLH